MSDVNVVKLGATSDVVKLNATSKKLLDNASLIPCQCAPYSRNTNPEISQAIPNHHPAGYEVLLGRVFNRAEFSSLDP